MQYSDIFEDNNTMATPNDLNSPQSEIGLIPRTPSVEQMQRMMDDDEGNGDKVKMKKQLGLLEGVAIILGIIFGSGNNSFQKKLKIC